MRKAIIAGNWKMNKTAKEAREFLDNFEYNKDVEVILFPSYTALHVFSDYSIKFGAQNMHFEESGTYTGEISAPMLKELGCSCILLGHSDRRHKFNETNEMIANKVNTAIKHGFDVMLCVGETAEEKDAGKTEEVIKEQLTSCLKDVQNSDSIVIAYEPVWAISPGKITKDQKIATPEQAEEVHAFIRSVLSEKFNSEEIRILYGGSSSPDNVESLMKMSNIDGCLSGASSLDTDTFKLMIERA